ncbi:WhiB family transcriptional regulator [Streptomyces sp. CS014]|uniref:WhiB family transcriptional regulator n=1 Tax=Streptomyces sp. CS014 TaxID=2162707 RepID=UPI001EF5B1FC|nr:WhiB family transcriptional regulator [Streptomyces sp. CS014]
MSTTIFKAGKSHSAPATADRAADWRDAALCRSHPDPEMWFPKGTDAVSMANEQEAKAVCAGCPALAACRAWAIETRENSGVWGGLSEHERASLRRHGRIQRKRTPLQAFASIDDAYRTLTEKAGSHVLWTGGQEVVIGSVRMSPNQVSWRATRKEPPVGRVHKGCKHSRCVRHLVDQAMRDARKATTERSVA